MRRLATAVLLLLTLLELAQAEPRQSKERNSNYILRRQQAGQVSGEGCGRHHHELRKEG
jgi:hypothetical protein